MSVSFRARKEVCRVLLIGLASGLLLLSPAGTPPVLQAMGGTIEDLRDKLKSKKAGDRRKAARELGETLSREATPLLLEAVTDKDPEVRREVVKSLGLLRDRSAITMLLTALEGDVPAVRQEAIIALVNLYTEQDVSFFLTREAKRLYARLNPFSGPVASDDTVIEPDVKVASSVIDGIAGRLRDSNRQVRFYAANALGVLRGQSAIPKMVEGMKGSEPNLQVAILHSFYKIKDRSVAGEIQPYLFNTNKKVRDEAILILGLFKSREALPQLQTLYDQNPGRDVRLNCLEAIAFIGDASSLPLFQRHLGDGGPKYRQFAAEGIAGRETRRWRRRCRGLIWPRKSPPSAGHELRPLQPGTPGTPRPDGGGSQGAAPPPAGPGLSARIEDPGVAGTGELPERRQPRGSQETLSGAGDDRGQRFGRKTAAPAE